MNKTAKVMTNSLGVSLRSGRKKQRPAEFRIVGEPMPQWRDAKASIERWMLTEALGRTGGNMAAAGRLLGITKVAVLHAVRRHGMEALTHPSEDE